MIDISKLTEHDVGRNVIYHREYCDREFGKLSSWNEKFVFVRFKGPTGESCEPDDVSFEWRDTGYSVEEQAGGKVSDETTDEAITRNRQRDDQTL